MKKILSLFILSIFFLPSLVAYAQVGTVLPETKLDVAQCEKVMDYADINYPKARAAFNRLSPEDLLVPGVRTVTATEILGCGIKTGSIRLWMVPFYIRYILEFVISLAGLIAVAGIVYGGFLYLFAGLSDDKEKGKKAIMYGVIGFVLTMAAFALVNIVITLVSG